MALGLFSQLGACWPDLFSAGCRLAVEQIRNLATIAGALGALAIPFVITWVSRKIEKRRATAEFVRTIMAAPEVVERLQRLYQRRRLDEAPESERNGLVDPYHDGKNSLLFDIIIVLNYFEALCYQIEKKTVNEDYIFEAAKDTVIGINRIIIPRYEELSGINQKQYHPHIVNVADRWEKRIRKKGLPLQKKIPDPADESGGE